MIPYHNIDPVIISFGIFKISWYSLSYVSGILFSWYYSIFLAKKFDLKITSKQIDDFVTWGILSIIIGGRLGHVLFYDPVKYLSNPIEILKTYEGGMSFHGAIIGLFIAAIIYSRKYNVNLRIISDLICTTAPLGICLGRIANFINGELWGRTTDSPLGIIFPYAGNSPRHPSQIYEAMSEGLLLLIIMNILSFKYNSLRVRLLNTSIFLIIYGIFRFICEFFREPDDMIWIFTEGQFLSIPMIMIGLWLLKRRSDS